MANLKDLIVNGAARIIGKTYSSEFVGNVTGNVTGNLTGDVTGNVSGSSGSCTGNAATSSKLKTAVSLTTTDGTHTSTGVNFDGSTAASIKLPSTIAATFSGNLTGDVTGSVSGNAGTATKLKTARSLKITDDGTNTSTGVDFDGSGAVTLKLPSTIKASITGNVSGSSGSCTGNAKTATTADKTAQSLSIKDGASTPVAAIDSWNGSANKTLTIKGDSPVTTAATTSTGTITITHDKKGPSTTAATSAGDTANQTPGFGGTFKVTSATVDVYGHTTELTDHTVTIPSSVATASANGLMSSADKTTLDNVASTYATKEEVSAELAKKVDTSSVQNGGGTASWGASVTVGSVAGTNLTFTMPSNPNTDTKNTAGSTNTTSKIYLIGATSQAANPVTYSNSSVYTQNGQLYASKVWNAVFNDLADAIPVGEGDTLEAGYCYGFDGEHYTKTSEYMQKSYIGIHSDTFGFLMGHEEGKEKLNVAVSGFVLAYVDKEYEVGTPLTCTEDGCLTEIKLEDKIKYPERVVATYWKNEPNEEWGPEGKKVKVNGRRWVKVK